MRAIASWKHRSSTADGGGSPGARGPGRRITRAATGLAWSLLACAGDTASVAPPAPASPAPTTAFARLLDSLRTAYDLPALAGAVVTSDSIPSLDAVGFRMFGNPTRVTRDDRFHLGSVLKHQTSVLVAQLVASGSLSWSRTLADYLPDERATMRPEYADRTLRDLLSHTAGLIRDPGTVSTIVDARTARSMVVRTTLSFAPAATTGTYAYSNTGYMIAGAIVEKVLDKPFEQVMAERLWGPLGMTNAGWGAAGTALDQPAGHILDANGTRTIVLPTSPNADNPPHYGPAGRAHMSIGDWARFTQALLRAEGGRDTPVLSATAWKALTQGFVATGPGTSYGYGLGVSSRSWAGGRALSHDGTNTRHYAVTWIAPQRDFAVLLATNQYGPSVSAQIDAAAFRLIQFWLLGR